MSLRPYQVKANRQVRAAFAAGHKRVLLVIPTGGGKTVCFTQQVEDTDGPALIAAHRRELIRQASGKLSVPHGIIAPWAEPTDDRVQVASIQTLANRTVGPQRLIVPDEAHHTVSPTWRRFLDSQPDALVLGVTATPERLDGRGLAAAGFTKMIVGPTIQELIDEGWLVPPVVFAPPKLPDMRDIPSRGGDYQAEKISVVMNDPAIIGDAVTHYGRHCPGEPAIAFCTSVANAERTAAMFRAEGWNWECVHGDMPADERDAILASVGDGMLAGVSSCSLIDEGVDLPALSCVIDLCPSQSLGRCLQRWGRAMRPAEGKTHWTLLDHVGNAIFRHGSPDEDRQWNLQGRPKRDREAVPKIVQCPTCYRVHRPAAVCPSCGHDYKLKEAAERHLRELAGELTALVTEDPRLLHLRSAPLRELIRGCRTFDDVEAIRRARGYKAGWTEIQMSYLACGRSPATVASDGMEFA